MPRTVAVLVTVCQVALGGCHSASSPNSSRNALEDLRVGPPLVHEVYTGFAESARFVVRDAEQWAEVWNKVYAGRPEVPPRPVVDFSSEMVVVAAQGSQGSSGYDISIDRVAVRRDALQVDVTATVPERSCITLAVVTAPVMMVRVEAFGGRIEFNDRTRVARCD
jgi:hypothetical protein